MKLSKKDNNKILKECGDLKVTWKWLGSNLDFMVAKSIENKQISKTIVNKKITIKQKT